MAIKGKVASFAHLLGISAKKAEEDEDKKRDDETDEEYAKRMEEEKDEKEKADDGDDDAKKAEEDDKKEDDTDSAKKAKKAEEDEDEKEKAARKSERARCRAIFASDAAGSRPDVAAHLAFDTDMDVKSAIALLDVAAVGNVIRPGLAHRMASVALPQIVSDAALPSANSAEGKASQIIAAGKKRRGEV